VTRLVRLAVEALRDRAPPPRIEARPPKEKTVRAARTATAAPGEGKR
jgi:hypothetical protein